MAATTPSTSLVPVQPAFTDAERLALAGFLAGYLAEGKTHREALRSLKRQVSDAVFTRLRAGAQRAQAQVRDPGGQ